MTLQSMPRPGVHRSVLTAALMVCAMYALVPCEARAQHTGNALTNEIVQSPAQRVSTPVETTEVFGRAEAQYFGHAHDKAAESFTQALVQSHSRLDSLFVRTYRARCHIAMREWKLALRDLDWVADHGDTIVAGWCRGAASIIRDSTYSALAADLGPNIDGPTNENVPIASANDLYFLRTGTPPVGLDTLRPGLWRIKRRPDGSLSGARQMPPDTGQTIAWHTWAFDGQYRLGHGLGDQKDDGWSFYARNPARNRWVPIEQFMPGGDSLKVRGLEMSLAPDGLHVIVSLIADTTRGGTGRDLFVSTWTPAGWTALQPLAALNRSAEDESPTLSVDGRTLIYRSTMRPELGHGDLFWSRRQDTSWTNWSEPRNLGTGINSEDWDGYPTLCSMGDTLYFASGRDGGQGGMDVYQGILPADARPTRAALIKVDLHGLPRDVIAPVWLTSPQGATVARSFATADASQPWLPATEPGRYTVHVSAAGKTQTTVVDVPPLGGAQVLSTAIIWAPKP